MSCVPLNCPSQVSQGPYQTKKTPITEMDKH